MKSDAAAMLLRMMLAAKPLDITFVLGRIAKMVMCFDFLTAAPAGLLRKFSTLQCSANGMLCTYALGVAQCRFPYSVTYSVRMLLRPFAFPCCHLLEMRSAISVNGNTSLLCDCRIRGIARATSSVIAVSTETITAFLAVFRERIRGLGFATPNTLLHAFDFTGGQAI